MKWTVTDSNRFYFSHSHQQSFQAQVLAPNFMISLLKIPSTQSCLHQSLYKDVSPFPKCSLFPHHSHTMSPKKGLHLRSTLMKVKVYFLSYPALTQETPTISLPFINQTCLCLHTIAYCPPTPNPYFPISSSQFSLVTLICLYFSLLWILTRVIGLTIPHLYPLAHPPVTQTTRFFLPQSLMPHGYLCLPSSSFTSYLTNSFSA